MLTADYHMHTSISTDGEAEPAEMVKAAIGKGMQTVCITDHLDVEYPFYEDMGEHAFCFNVDSYFQELEELREQFRGQIEIRIGVELGLQPHLAEECRRVTEKYPFDFVIGSVHMVRHTDPYYGEIFQDQSDADAYRETFQETIDILNKITSFDVLGHLDYIVRYGKHKEKEYSYEAFAPYLDEILNKIIQNGKGIELNTAGWKYGLGFCHPHPAVIKRYRELGGEIITVGADSHRPEQVAYHFPEASRVLEECGFRYYAEYQGRKPIFKKLV